MGPYGRMRADLGSQVDYERMRRERRDKARKAMEKHGLDAVLCLIPENCRYLTIGPAYPVYRYVLFAKDVEQPVHYEAGMLEPAYRDIPGQEVKMCIGLPAGLLLTNEVAYDRQVDKLVVQMKQELKRLGISSGNIGIDINNPRLINALEKEGIKITLDGWRAMGEARKTKTKDEIEVMRTACAMVEAGFQRAREVIRPGITEQQIYAEMVKTMLYAGAEIVGGGHVSSGPHSWPIANTRSDRLIRPGDIILIDIYELNYLGYKTCYYRNFSCGKPTEAQKEAWAKARDFTWNAFKMMKPGVTTKEIVEHWPKAEEFGFPDEEAACLCQWAHGIGLTLYEQPMISRIWSLDYPEVLEEGMVMAFETLWPTNEKCPDYPNGQCLRIEEEVAITSTGVDVLSKWPIDGIIECEPL